MQVTEAPVSTKFEDWDALEVELAGDGWPYRAPNRGHLGLR